MGGLFTSLLVPGLGAASLLYLFFEEAKALGLECFYYMLAFAGVDPSGWNATMDELFALLADLGVESQHTMAKINVLIPLQTLAAIVIAWWAVCMLVRLVRLIFGYIPTMHG